MVDATRTALILAVVAALALLWILGVTFAGCGILACFGGEVPELSAEQLQGAVIERPPGTLWKTVDLVKQENRDELLAAYEQLYPWGDEKARVFPDLELRLLLADGRTIGVAAQEGDPEMLVRVYKDEELTSEVHVAGRQMYDFLYPDSTVPYPYELPVSPTAGNR